MDAALTKAITLLARGHQWQQVNVKTHVDPRARPKQCFHNAFNYVTNNDGSQYVLGLLVMWGQVPIEHAWVFDPELGHIDTTIIDPDPTDIYIQVTIPDRDFVLDWELDYGSAPTLFDITKAAATAVIRAANRS